VILDHPVPPTLSLTTIFRTYSISLHNVWVGRIIVLTYFITVGVRCHSSWSKDPHTHADIWAQFQWFCNMGYEIRELHSPCNSYYWHNDTYYDPAVMTNVSATVFSFYEGCIERCVAVLMIRESMFILPLSTSSLPDKNFLVVCPQVLAVQNYGPFTWQPCCLIVSPSRFRLSTFSSIGLLEHRRRPCPFLIPSCQLWPLAVLRGLWICKSSFV
jgi:hypothetical protein